MKKILLICFLTFLSNFVSAQEMSAKQLEGLSEANKALYNELNIAQIQREERIVSYVLANNIKRRYYSSNGGVSEIKDIVNGKPIYVSTDNADAAIATKTNQLQVGGALGLDLDGTGMLVGLWDGGPVQKTHPEFADASGVSRINVVEIQDTDGQNMESDHGTHVAGTIGARGVDPDAKGMATNVNIKSYNFNNDMVEMLTAVTDVSNPIILSNHSYGLSVDNFGENNPWFMGAYVQDSRNLDEIAFNNPKYLPVYSAGNDGNVFYTGGLVSGYDKLTGDKTSKNNLVIANASPTVFFGTLNLDINSSSSQGPTDDLRVKPDIAADGTGLYSPVPTNSYATFSGTSMAAPNTTGTLVLLQQYYSQLNGGNYMNSATLKAIVCHTAVDDPNTIGPDPIFGWGFLDAKASAELITDNSTNSAVIEERTLNNNETYSYTFTAEAGDKLAATICWTDLPGAVASGTLNDPTPALVNDLDLRITKDGTTFFPWKLDLSGIASFTNSKGDNIVDNIERIDIDVPETGTYTLTVSHKGTLQGNVLSPFLGPNEQDYSLLLSGNNLTLGTNDYVLSNSLSIYPNPNNGVFTVSFDSNVSNSSENVKVDIYDISGRIVYKNIFANNSSQFNETINLTDVSSGVYLASISQGNNKTTKKIIIE